VLEMTKDFKLIELQKAIKDLKLDQHFQGRTTLDQYEPGDHFVRHYGNAVIAGDLDMDELLNESDVAGIVVDGDLELDGSIVNWEIDTTAAFLWVRGNLRCSDIIFGSMDLVVSRNVTASNLIVATYNHGHLLIGGDVHAKTVIIDDDGPSTIDGKIHSSGWNASQNADVKLRRSDWIREVKPEFRDEFFDEEGGVKCGSGNVDLVKALLAGRDILRPER
jgi:hypothetical protein